MPSADGECRGKQTLLHGLKTLGCDYSRTLPCTRWEPLEGSWLAQIIGANGLASGNRIECASSNIDTTGCVRNRGSKTVILSILILRTAINRPALCAVVTR